LEGPLPAVDLRAQRALAFAPSGDLFLLDSLRLRQVKDASKRSFPSINAGGVVNAASQVGDAVSPGELVSIYGTNYAFDALDVAAHLNGAIPPFLGHTRVLVGGLLAPITAASPTQINALILT
jgi:hypothetical protein